MISYPYYVIEGHSILCKLKHIGKRVHGTRRITTRSYYYELHFTNQDISDPIVIPLVLEKCQLFADNNIQDEYYAGDRIRVNAYAPPSYYVRYLPRYTELPSNELIKAFINKGITKNFAIDETQFHSGVKSGYWFFLDDTVVGETTDVIDSNEDYWIQINYRHDPNNLISTEEIAGRIVSKLQGQHSWFEGPTFSDVKAENYFTIQVRGSHTNTLHNIITDLRALGLSDVYATFKNNDDDFSFL